MKSSVTAALFVNAPQVKLIDFLYVDAKRSEQFATRDLARRAGVAYGSVDRAMKGLVARGLVTRLETQDGPRFRAPFEDARLRHLFLLLRQGSGIVSALQRALRGVKSVRYACVFGSFARGEDGAQSDIDVLILRDREEEQLEIYSQLQRVADRFGREVNPHLLDTQEFLRNVETGEAVAKNILASARIELLGTPPW
jgi:predicted nucleotidyltransferase